MFSAIDPLLSLPISLSYKKDKAEQTITEKTMRPDSASLWRAQPPSERMSAGARGCPASPTPPASLGPPSFSLSPSTPCRRVSPC